MDFDLKGRTALITGGSRGIGRAIGHALAAQGVNVAFCGRTPETLESTAGELREYGVGVWPVQADVSRLEEIQRFVGEAREAAGGRIDILINNAVTSLSAPFDEQSDDHWRYHIDVKLMAYIRCAREVLPAMRERRWGRIVNIGGMTARITAPLRVTNGIVNAGVANFTKQLSGQVGGDNITVNCVHPGTTATDRMMKMFERRARDAGVQVGDINEQTVAAIPLGRLIKPEDIAAAALFFCSPMAEVITGQSIAVDGGASDAVIY
jgi:NAD(P)-dependent dehydrogenase (short-subunit alcohol dehydrogenase family)